MISIWEKASLLSYDVIIVGAGITGLSTAASIKEKSPQLSVLILERGTLPTGASTKNAGFACFGSLSELLQDHESMGDEGTKNLVEMRWKGLAKTRKRLGDQKIGYESCGGFELIPQAVDNLEGKIQKANHLLEKIVGNQVFSLDQQKITAFGFNKVQQLIFNAYEGALDTGKLIGALWDYCSQLGVRVITGTTVSSYYPSGAHILVKTEKYDFKAKKLAFSTNAFTQSLLKEKLDLKPGRGMVLYIKTEKPVKFQGTFHYDQGFYYFRHYKDGLLFGGGRNLDKSTEETLEFGSNDLIMKRLISDLETMILPDQKYQIELVWSGIMAFGETKQPIISEISNNIYLGVRLGGMGIAIGSMVGEELASLVIKDHF